MNPAAVLQTIQIVVGLCLVGYAAAIVVRQARFVTWPASWVRGRSAAPVDDLRVVIDMAARLRDAGNPDAVKVCQSLIDELLKPQTK